MNMKRSTMVCDGMVLYLTRYSVTVTDTTDATT